MRPPAPAASASRRAVAALLAASLPASLLRPAALALDEAEVLVPRESGLALEAVDPRVAPPRATSRCFFDLSVGGRPAGRVVIELYGELMPKTSENFRRLCTGSEGFGYAGSSFYRIISGLTLQGGDIAYEGKPGRSIYGGTFPHEGYALSHSVDGLVSMAGPQQSDSRFVVQMQADAGYLDGRYPAFGRVVEGMGILRGIEQIPVKGTRNAPTERVSIDAAGELP